jgi:ketosteroid isomerase-like protein
MPEEPTTPDLAQRVRDAFQATDPADLDQVMSFYAPGAVWEVIGLGTVMEGAQAIRAFLEEWTSAYEEFRIDIEEILELGAGVTFAVLVQSGRPVGSTERIRYRFAQLATWVDGVVARIAGYNDIDQARAAAERLAQERE